MPNTYTNKVQVTRGGQTETLIDLTGDTVTAATLMQGYTAHDAPGALITGTATGGGGSVSQDANGYIVLPSTGGGGGGTNCVCGTFKETTGGQAITIALDYSGSGYPIAVFVSTTDSAFDEVTQSYAVRDLTLIKHELDTAPTYSGGIDENYAMQSRKYRNNSAYQASATYPYTAYSTSPATSGNTLSLRITSNTTLSAYIQGASSYGFAVGVEYTYYVVYSS